ncbi:MAG TPA: histidine kinase [Thermoanaerobaculia bacterium]|nr:histidine kinase [Thermoanaerobaculia bacterium]
MTPYATPHRRLAHLFLIAAVIVSLWALVGLYNASEFYRTGIAVGGRPDWAATLHFHMVMSLNWAVWTPLIMAIAERLPLDPAHRLRSLRNLGILTVLIPLLALGRAMWGGAVLRVAEGRDPTLDFMKLSVVIRLHSYIAMTAGIVVVTYLIAIYRESRAREQNALTLQAAVANAEAEHLRSELQPALVFETLTAIRERVRTDPRTADRMIVRLAEMLRRGLDRRAGRDASIEDELDHTDRYVELQRFRFGADIVTRSLIDDDVLAARVPPLALQTLIDSAISSSVPRLIELRGNTAGNALHLEARVLPSRMASVEDRTARLRNWFGPDCHTRLAADDDAMIASVELPLEYIA